MVNGSGHFEALLKNGLLALEAHVAGPLHKAGQIAAGVQVLANAEILRGSREKVLVLLVEGNLLLLLAGDGLLRGLDLSFNLLLNLLRLQGRK